MGEGSWCVPFWVLLAIVCSAGFAHSAELHSTPGDRASHRNADPHSNPETLFPPTREHRLRAGRWPNQANGWLPFTRPSSVVEGHAAFPGTHALWKAGPLRSLPSLVGPNDSPPKPLTTSTGGEKEQVRALQADSAPVVPSSTGSTGSTGSTAGSGGLGLPLPAAAQGTLRQMTGGQGEGERAAVAEAEVQKQALLAFRRAASSDPTGVLGGWRWSQPSACNWTGVTCLRPGRVFALNLTDRQVAGRLDSGPPPLGRLWDMRSLLLSGNSLQGSIPASLAQATRLDVLELAGSNLEGSIPDAISGIPNLRVLILNGNRLSGSFPGSMGNMTSLRIVAAEDNMLQGSLPTSFSRLTSLEQMSLQNNSLSGPLNALLGRANSSPLSYLNLRSNNFSGWLPWGLGLRTNLTFLDLSGNQLSDSIPGFIGNLQSLKTLNLSNNRLTGTLPSSLNMMTSLVTLDLSNNQISGSLPFDLALLSGLTYLNVSFNNLSGVVPSTGTLSNFPESSFAGNPYLCYTNCTPPPPPAPANGTNPCPTGMGGPPPPPYGVTVVASPPGGMSSGAIVAIVVAGVGLAILTTTLFTIYVCSVSPSEDDLLVADMYGSEGGATSKPSLPSAADFPDEGQSHLLTMFDDSKSVCLSDVLRATDQLGGTKRVGGGGTGTVYRAQLPNGKAVAVKRLSAANLDSLGSPVKFKEQAQALASLTHENVLPLLGFWADREQHLVLSDWMPRGNLHTFLHSSADATWQGRFKAALGVAQALKYLHHSCNPPLSHGCLHPGNVLLDSRGEAKVGDVGVARLVFGNSSVQVTPQGVGYAAPELVGGGMGADAKGDVYSLGVMLLELISGKPPTDASFAEAGAVDLVGWVKGKQGEGQLDRVFDSRLVSAESKEELMQIAKVALMCVVDDPVARPTSAEVVSMLVRAKDTAARIKQNPALRDLLT